MNPLVIGGSRIVAHLSVKRIGTSHPAYWELTFVDSDGIPHIGIGEGEHTVFLGAMIKSEWMPTFSAEYSGVTAIGNSLYQVTNELAQFY